jgi:hypothetical protein
LNGLGSVFANTDPRTDIAAMLIANGYAVDPKADATLPMLRSINGDGIFYLRTHGGSGSVNADVSTNDTYALWTATSAMDSTAEQSDATLTADLKAGRVVYMLFRDDRWSQAFPNLFPKERHYGITDKFVQQYMSFADNSFVYIDACRGGSQASLLAAFHAKNASVVAGWTENAVMGGQQQTANYVFDRLLGANVFDAENPKQRPFSFSALLQDPRFGSGKPYGATSFTASDSTVVEALLVFHPQGSGFEMLAPGISNLAADEAHDQLVIGGEFGSDPGQGNRTVTINDGSGEVALAVIDWKPYAITTDLKRTGPGSAGNVVVTVRGHHSNTRQLLAWKGSFHYVLSEVGSLTQAFDLDFQIRIDPLVGRLVIAERPVMTFPLTFVPAMGKQATYSAGGSYSTTSGDCTSTWDWSGSGTISTDTLPATGQVYIYSGTINPEQKRLSMAMQATDGSGLTLRLTTQCPTGTNVSSSTSGIGFEPHAAGLISGLSLDLSLKDDLTILGNSIWGSVHSLFALSMANTTLAWSNVAPFPAFNPDLPR